MSNVHIKSPRRWQKVRLGELAQIASGVTKGRRLDGTKTVLAPYLRVANVQAGHLDLSEIKEIEVMPSDIEKYRLLPGDMLMTEGGDRDKLGRGTVWRGEVADCIHQNHVFRVRADRTRLLPEYLSRYLGTPDAKAYFLRAAKQTTGIATINSSQLNDFPIVVPPIHEQRRITAILDKADAISRKREEGIRLTEELLRSTFLDMFGDPETNPKNWVRVPLTGLLAIPPNYGSMIKPHDEPVGWLDLRVANIQDGELKLSSEKYINLPCSMIERHEVRDGDLLMARAIGSLDHLGKCVVVRPGNRKWAFDSHLMRLRFDQGKVFPEFVRQFLTIPGGRHEFLKHTRRSAVQFNINTKELARIQIPLPPLEAQSQYINHCNRINLMGARRREALSESEQGFSSLVQRAFRGEL